MLGVSRTTVTLQPLLWSGIPSALNLDLRKDLSAALRLESEGSDALGDGEATYTIAQPADHARPG